MATTLATRAEIRRELYRLVGLSEDDTVFDEHSENQHDTANGLIQQAIWDLQWWWIDNVEPGRWVTQSSAITFSGTDALNGGKYSALPTTFLRLYGDEENSGLRSPDGTRWGMLIQTEDRHARFGPYYYLLDDNLWIGRGASPPADLIMDYNARHATLADADDELTTAIDVPLESRVLIPTIAARLAGDLAVFPLPDAHVAKLRSREKIMKAQIYARGRRTREPRKARTPRALGNHWMRG